ncbi:peptide-methionine (S)-S-oxide reductase MsrA [Sphingomicrobium sediminis]|uniref:Peptide methionine sulfoxide reductase MsrA n=1 Tax=Sphingomicrobium sediminis TaxID=2950949 RepID=A0A9X2EER2_9SPHN|nr:peptide-methionine (S)-S-oxide reductase MsrA [Sphingomicrobium sediminis]MCM8556578.1 peptide-methionine (S)-S-oxide reductase MsrA [Sphingomicrobium sediminis]
MAKQTAILANGCFWCTEAVFLDVIGVESVESGYIGGHVLNPTYREVCGGNTGHAEAIKLVFEDEAISYEDLLEIFFATHDPTQLNRQGNDVGTQYRSAIFPLDEEQRQIAMRVIAETDAAIEGKVVTTIEEATEWYPAEDYHQDYYAENGNSNPYCMAIIDPKLRKFRKSFADKLKNRWDSNNPVV